MIEKYEKTEPEFPEILLTVFILRCVYSRGVQSMGGPSGKWAKSGYTVYEVEMAGSNNQGKPVRFPFRKSFRASLEDPILIGFWPFPWSLAHGSCFLGLIIWAVWISRFSCGLISLSVKLSVVVVL
jgi:hypothetical protein